jgi:hypothetical protein
MPAYLMAVVGISTSGLGALTTTPPPPRPRLGGGCGCDAGRGDSSPGVDELSLGDSLPGVAKKALKALWKSDMCRPLPLTIYELGKYFRMIEDTYRYGISFENCLTHTSH